MPNSTLPSKEAMDIANNPVVHYVTPDQTVYFNDAKGVIEEVLKNYISGVHIAFQDEEIEKAVKEKIHNDAFFGGKTDFTIEELIDTDIVVDSIIDDAAYICMQHWAEGDWSLAHALLVAHTLSHMVANLTGPYQKPETDNDTTKFPAFRVPNEGEQLS